MTVIGPRGAFDVASCDAGLFRARSLTIMNPLPWGCFIIQVRGSFRGASHQSNEVGDTVDR
jgi:hypothetical protein